MAESVRKEIAPNTHDNEEKEVLKGVDRAKLNEEANKGQKEQTSPTKQTSLTWSGKRRSEPLDKKPVFGLKSGSGITIKLAPDTKKKKQEPVVQKKAGSVAAAFGDDESDEEEEIPPEAKMRMRNIGRDTPTSAGPNSFNKGKKGFTHHGKVFEKHLKEMKPP